MTHQEVSESQTKGTTSSATATQPEALVEPKVKLRIVPIEVLGICHGEEVRQEFSFTVPRDAPNDQLVLGIWEALSRSAGLTVAQTDSEYKFYPFHLFEEPLTARIKPESGVKI